MTSPRIYTERIAGAWAEARAKVFEVGEILIEAKANLAHGEYEAMIERDLPFSPSTARKLAAVARCDFLKRAPVHDLPADYSSLYEITKLGEDGFEAARSAGEIRGDTPRSQIERIVKRHKAGQAAAVYPPADPVVGCGVDDLARAVDAGVRFPVIYADPPWQFETRSDLGQDKSPSMHYETMTLEDLAALPISDLAADDAALFMWVVPWSLFDARPLLEAWGFEFKTVGFYWFKAEIEASIDGETGAPFGEIKADVGTGYFTRKSVEQCLIATRGRPSPLATDVRDFALERRGPHSQKPEIFARQIERIFAGPYLELFARRPRSGWSVWGNEVAADGVFLEKRGRQ